MGKFQFDKQKIDQIEKNYSKLALTEDSRTLIDVYAKLYTGYLNISDLAMRGLISLALRDFQIQTRVEVSDLPKMPHTEQIKNYEIISKILFEKIEKVLAKPEQKEQLRVAIREAMQKSVQD